MEQKKSQVVYQLDESQHAQVNITKGDYISIETDKPVLVQQYVVTHVTQGDCGNRCGSFLLTVPPMQQRKQQYVFSTADSATGKHNVNLIVATSLRNGVLINGTDLLSYINSSNFIHPAAAPTWNIIDQNQNSINNNKNSLSSIQFPVNAGLHRISHNSSSDVLFTVTSVPHTNEHEDLSKLHVSETAVLNRSLATTKLDNIVPTAQVEKVNVKDEISNAFLSETQSSSKQQTDIPHSVMALIISVMVAVIFVIICIVGFVFVEFAFHNGERSLFKCARVAPYEEIKD